MILRYLVKTRYNLSRKHFDGSKLLITRRHRAIPFRRTLGNSETFINYIISFKIERQVDLHKLEAEKSPHGQNKYVHLKPILEIHLHSKSSPLNCCSFVLELDRYILNRTQEAMEAKLTKGNLELYCDLLLQELFVLDGEVKFKTNPRLIFNDPMEFERGVQLDEPVSTPYIEPSEDDRFIQRGLKKLPDGAWLNDLSVNEQPPRTAVSKSRFDLHVTSYVVCFCAILLKRLKDNTISPELLEKYSKKKILYHGITKYDTDRLVRIRCVAKSEASLASLTLRPTEVSTR